MGAAAEEAACSEGEPKADEDADESSGNEAMEVVEALAAALSRPL